VGRYLFRVIGEDATGKGNNRLKPQGNGRMGKSGVGVNHDKPGLRFRQFRLRPTVDRAAAQVVAIGCKIRQSMGRNPVAFGSGNGRCNRHRIAAACAGSTEGGRRQLLDFRHC
jgi:hypothetical protein